ncbi:MAG: C40 family peptidase [Bacillus sp. (in: Bacteria)]|nr:C40 family peptidase [Bacillus sp. (in: firmicutes)]
MSKTLYGFVRQEFCNLGEKPFSILGESVVTQARLSEPVKIVDEQNHWYRIEMSDGYSGWIQSWNIEVINEGFWHEWLNSPHVLIMDKFTTILSWSDFRVLCGAVMATRLRLIGENESYYIVALPNGNSGLVSKSAGFVINSFGDIPRGSYDNIISTAKKFIGLPYYWGGTTPYGFDCSGFVQTLFLINGYKLPRDADLQFVFKDGESIDGRSRLQKGDAVFFGKAPVKPSHVGIYIGNMEYIHSSGKTGVCINSFSPEAQNYREDLDRIYIGARRYKL